MAECVPNLPTDVHFIDKVMLMAQQLGFRLLFETYFSFHICECSDTEIADWLISMNCFFRVFSPIEIDQTVGRK